MKITKREKKRGGGGRKRGNEEEEEGERRRKKNKNKKRRLKGSETREGKVTGKGRAALLTLGEQPREHFQQAPTHYRWAIMAFLINID